MSQSLPVNAATLFAAGALIDVIVMLSWYATINNKIVLASIVSFLMTNAYYLSYIFVLGHAKLEENVWAIQYYALGNAAGTLVCFGLMTWLKRRRLKGAENISCIKLNIIQPDRITTVTATSIKSLERRRLPITRKIDEIV